MVYDGPNDQSMAIGELFGTPNRNVTKSISSSGKYIFIKFSKTTFSGVVDFVASINYNKINPDCQSWLENNIITSPNNPNINCSWVITRKFRSYLTIEFKFIEVKLMNNTAKNALIFKIVLKQYHIF